MKKYKWFASGTKFQSYALRNQCIGIEILTVSNYLYPIKNAMHKEEILRCIKSLARSQGCWWRLLHSWIEDGVLEQALDELEEMNFKNSLDLVLFLEGNA